MQQETKDKLLQIVDQNPFMHAIGLEILTLEEGHCIGRIPYDISLTNPYASIHGGVLYTLADCVAGFAACSYGKFASTVSGTINYVSPAHHTAYITCEAICIRQGKSLAVYNTTTTDDNHNILQSGSFNYYLMNRDV